MHPPPPHHVFSISYISYSCDAQVLVCWLFILLLFPHPLLLSFSHLVWNVGLLWWVQSYQHWSAVSHCTTDPIHTVSHAQWGQRFVFEGWEIKLNHSMDVHRVYWTNTGYARRTQGMLDIHMITSRACFSQLPWLCQNRPWFLRSFYLEKGFHRLR